MRIVSAASTARPIERRIESPKVVSRCLLKKKDRLVAIRVRDGRGVVARRCRPRPQIPSLRRSGLWACSHQRRQRTVERRADCPEQFGFAQRQLLIVGHCLDQRLDQLLFHDGGEPIEPAQ